MKCQKGGRTRETNMYKHEYARRHSSIPVLLGWLVEKPGKNRSAKLDDEVPKRGEDKGIVE